METLKAITPQEIEKAAFILKTVSHPSRLAIVRLLGEKGECAVSDICQELDLEQSAASQHLKDMKLKGLLSSRKEGKWVKYRLETTDILKIFECLKHCEANL